MQVRISDNSPVLFQITSSKIPKETSPMRRKPCLTTEDVLKMVAACKQHGARINREPTIAVVDAGGHLLHLERPDRNGVNTVEMATLKARTAALRGRPSAAFAA